MQSDNHLEIIFLNLAQQILSGLDLNDDQERNIKQEPKLIFVSSCRQGEGKTFVSRAIARHLANLIHDNVVLVDGNFTNPSLHKDYQLSGPGISDCLLDGNWSEGIYSSPQENLSVIPVGSVARRGDLFKPALLAGIRRNAPERCAIMVIDGGILEMGGKNIVSHTDGTILVIDASSTRREIVQGTFLNLGIQKDKILGVILNKKHYHIPDFLYRYL